MLNIVLSNQFKKDVKLAAKRGYNLDLLDVVVEKLANQQTLGSVHKLFSRLW